MQKNQLNPSTKWKKHFKRSKVDKMHTEQKQRKKRNIQQLNMEFRNETNKLSHRNEKFQHSILTLHMDF